MLTPKIDILIISRDYPEFGVFDNNNFCYLGCNRTIVIRHQCDKEMQTKKNLEADNSGCGYQ